MSTKLNCWEFKNCGREPGGLLADSHGVCPVALALRYDGLNEGKGAGRACWLAQAEQAKSRLDDFRPVSCDRCADCDFHLRVLFEEEPADAPAISAR